MPCAVCERWIEAISRILTLRWRGDVVVGLGAFSGEEVVSVNGLDHQTEYRELRANIANHLTERYWPPTMTFYKDDQVLGDRTQLGDLDQVLVKVVEQSGWMRWRLCECEPPPDYIRRVTISPRHQRQWYFICDDCQGRNPILRWYGNIDRDGIASEWDSESGDEWDDWDRISWFGG